MMTDRCHRMKWLITILLCSFLLIIKTQPSCYNCPFGTTSPARSTSVQACVGCNPGSYLPDSSDLCLPCLPGSYAIKNTASSCIKCPLGKTTIPGAPYTSLSNSSACLSFCPAAGQYTRVNGTCASCARGFYCGSGDAAMIQCPNGLTTVPGFAAQSLADCTIACPAGYGVETLHGTCQPCPFGTYSPDANTACTSCPIGYTTMITGATTSTACVGCPPGQYLSLTIPGPTGCINCGKGKYSTADMVSSGSCLGICPTGTTTSPKAKTGAIADTDCVTLCLSGQYVPIVINPDQVGIINAGECTDCPAGTYENGNLCKTCKGCKDTGHSAAVDVSECANDAPTCNPGQGPDEVNLQCADCPARFYSGGGTGALICGGSPTVSPTTQTLTYIQIHHSYSFTLGLTKFGAAQFIPAFSAAVATSLSIPIASVQKFVKPSPSPARRRYLLAGYTSMLSYVLVVPNKDPQLLTAAIANPAFPASLTTGAQLLTGISATIGTISYLDTSPTSGPSTLPTPFIFNQYNGNVTTNGIDTKLLITVILVVGLGVPFFACCIYQFTLLLRVLTRPRPQELKGDNYDDTQGRRELNDDEFTNVMAQDSNVREVADVGNDDRNPAGTEESQPAGWDAYTPSISNFTPTLPTLPFLSNIFGSGVLSDASAPNRVQQPRTTGELTQPPINNNNSTNNSNENDFILDDNDDDDDKFVEMGEDDNEDLRSEDPPSGSNSWLSWGNGQPKEGQQDRF